ncbi:MAG: hypothetical protein LBQ54_06870 [Planctomycetaceae bacterium]|nr:hypothetical protein [Planctomycetaceae bacterium]
MKPPTAACGRCTPDGTAVPRAVNPFALLTGVRERNKKESGWKRYLLKATASKWPGANRPPGLPGCGAACHATGMTGKKCQ